MNPDLGILLGEHKFAQFFADKVVLYLAYVITTFVLVDSFISLIPNGNGMVGCFIKSTNVDSGQQSYVNEYCAEFVPEEVYKVPLLIFCQGLITALLHYAWYSMVLFTNNVKNNTIAQLENASTQLQNASSQQQNVNASQLAENPALSDAHVSLANASTQLASANTHLVGARCGGCMKTNRFLLFFYFLKLLAQFILALVALVYAVDYEYYGNIAISSRISKRFNCSIKDDGVNYWPELDTVQCFYNTTALNDIFVNFYIAILSCMMFALLWGLIIFARIDLMNGCEVPTDATIVNYILDKKPNNDTVITIRGSEILNVKGVDFTLKRVST